MDSVAEEWRPVFGFPYYEASNLGRVRSIPRLVQSGRGKPGVMVLRKGKILKQIPSKGYLVVKLGGPNKAVGVHRAVALAFHGPCPEGLVVDHVDTNKHNNAPGNLEYVTNTENVKRQYAKGLLCNKGETHGGSKLTDAEAREIFASKGHIGSRQLAERFNVHPHHIQAIWRGVARPDASLVLQS